MAVGSGKLTYEVIQGWAKLPSGWAFKQVGTVAVDRQDRVYVFCRGEHPVILFDRDGQFIRSWGEGHFKSAHGMCFDAQGNLWLADSADHTVKKFSAQGKHLLTLGTKDQPGAPGQPFNRPTDVAVAPTGEVYISDGYGNARVHVFSSEGRHLFSWGEPGTGPGQFNLPHNIWVHKDGRVLVSDRENHRIQIFTKDGKYITQWTGFRQPTDIYIDVDETVYVAELQSRVSILDLQGNLLARWGGEKSHAPGEFYAPHGIWTDSRGDLYVGEVLEGQRVQKFRRVR